MKLIILIIYLISLLSCQSGVSKQKEIGIIARTELRGCFELPQHDDSSIINDSILFFLIDVMLINTSNESIEFITYTCSSSGNIVLDNKAIRVSINRCSGNGPMPVELKPNQELSIPVILQAQKKDSFTKIRIGWVFIESDSKVIKSFSDISSLLLRKRERQEDVIWSEPLYLSASGGTPFELRSL